MTHTTSVSEAWPARFLGVLRIVSGLLFMQHGAQKLFGLFATPQMHSVPLFSFMGLGGALEFFGGLLLVLGLFARLVAFILAGEMAVAYFMFHAPRGFWPISTGGDLAVLLCFVFLYLAVAGGGAWSLDRALRGKSRNP